MGGTVLRDVLDTSTFFYPAALARLALRHYDVVVPAVAFAERTRQLARAGRGLDEFLDFLGRCHYLVEPFGREQALQSPIRLVEDARWRRLSRDAFIAAHVLEDDILWTANPRDFGELGVSSTQIVDVTRLDDPEGRGHS